MEKCFRLNQPREQIQNLDILPMWDRGLIDYKKYHQYVGQSGIRFEMTVQGTRGCPFRCFYCDVQHLTPMHRRRSVLNIVSEIDYLHGIGVRNIEFIDDAFNVVVDEFKDFFRSVIKRKYNMNFYFQSGLRGDLLDEEGIDLMVEGGVKSVNLSLESASPRLQKMMRKNLKIDKLYNNLQYIVSKYPYLIVGLNAMHGFPTETEEEAIQTIDFIKSIKWLHFAQYHNVRIFPGSLLEKIALENGVTQEEINESLTIPYHLMPTTIKLDPEFSRKLRLDFTRNYVFNRERMRYVLDKQIRVMNEDELMYKYRTIFPTQINTLDDILRLSRLKREDFDFSIMKPKTENNIIYPNEPRVKEKKLRAGERSLRILFLDCSQFFPDSSNQEINAVEPPLGYIAILSYLNQVFGDLIDGIIKKSGIDYSSFDELKELLALFKPDLISIRTMTYFKDFFAETVRMIRKYGYSGPIIAGGPHPTIAPEETLRSSDIQAVSIGEGELVLEEVIKYMLDNKMFPKAEDLQKIKGLAFLE